MEGKGFEALLQYRHWRASVPVGICIAVAVALILVEYWPTLASDPSQFSKELRALVVAAGPVVVWLLLGLVAYMAGSAWCDLSLGIASGIHQLACWALPFDRDPSDWTATQRLRLPLSKSALRGLQVAMRRNHDFVDLDASDRLGAYRSVIRETFQSPYSRLGVGETSDAEVVRAVTDMRLLVGLFPWLPLAFYQFGIQLDGKAVGGLARLMTWLAIGTAVAVLAAAWRQLRALSSLVARVNCVDDRLSQHARSAQLSGRSPDAVREARHDLGQT